MDNLEEQLAKVVEKSLEMAEKTGEFAIEQAPELLEQFYMWHTAKHSFWLAVGLLITGIIVYGYYRALKYHDYDMGDIDMIPFNIICPVVGIISFTFSFISLYHLLFILIAPKLYLIEYFIK